MVRLPPYARELLNHYWMLRYHRSRSTAARRRYYRYIQAEKNRLFLAGFDKEEIRLICRYLSNPANNHAKTALLRYASQLRLDL